ncbi:MAG TPA: sigma 54-interacting transcriptional regulator [Thermoanaerobaculia bacterium]|nr:sigma 54-interacting transcriptional regulator [Thermoanaerobaculia bacterium]
MCVVHPCLGSPRGAVDLREARLTDRRRLGVLLQAAGLLSLLEVAGWHLPAEWLPARVTPEGLLAVEGGAAPGVSSRAAQELLRDLAALLFGTDGAVVAGRGEGRRAARAVLDGWRQSLVPVPPDAAVARILEVAPFLWEPAFAGAREALVGEVHRDDGVRLWVAGPRPLRLRLLARARSAGDLRSRLAGPEGRALWNREEEGSPGELASRGRFRAAVAAWERRRPTQEGERLEQARALFALGRFEAARETLAGLGSVPARALALRCHLLLGQLGAARVALLKLEREALAPDVLADLAEIAARVFANGDEPERAGRWVRRALRETSGGRAALRAWLVAADAAWDRGDAAAMDLWLEKARGALSDPELAWRWHHARSLRAGMDPEGGAEAVASVARALYAGRRLLPRHQAAGLWNDLGLGRAQAGDLPGAERAFLHALRLYSGCDGPRATTLALSNLAEIRLRRGRLAGVADILERSAAENRLAGNLRGLAQDLELAARHELVLGRPAAALALCRDTLADLDRRGGDWRRAELHLLAARALGWLGRPEEAAAELAHVTPGAWSELEPEERPALRAQAGDREGALAEAAGTPFASLWAREPAPSPAWEALGALEPYRAARLVFDLEVAAPGTVPPRWLREAIATFRRMGATFPAERLEARDQGPWQALATYLRREPGDPEAVALLLTDAGYPEAELVRSEGSLALQAPRIDATLHALFALIARDLAGGSHAPFPDEEPLPRTRREAGGMVGESPELWVALERIARLAPGGLPVLVLGESGTGKELAVRQIHRASARAAAPFVAINCAALSETLLMSDLFGHVRGAFTGADREHRGVFETAHGGTVFLDEIGDLPLAAQGLLLRVLQEGEVRRLGESVARRVNVRVLAATHRDLAAGVREGRFRQDLYYRLKVGSVTLPPLRDRGEDVLLLADRFLARAADEKIVRLSPEARARLLSYPWPGNVRELENVLSVASVLAEKGVIEPEHLEIQEASRLSESLYHQQVDAFRRGLIERALAACGGHLAEAARSLGISRQALSYLLRQLKIDRQASTPGNARVLSRR